jgi:hypothetical protein
MKLTLFGTVLFIFLLFSRCSDVDDLLTFYITDQTNIEISNGALNLPIEIPTPDISTNANQEFKNNNTKAELVKDVKLDHLNLTITNPANRNFNFLKSIHIYISTDQNDEIELAYLDNVPANVSSISLITSETKLDKYAKASSYKLRTAIVTKESVTQSIEVLLDLRFRVTADPL